METTNETNKKPARKKKTAADKTIAGTERPNGGPTLDWLETSKIESRGNVRSEIDQAELNELAADIQQHGMLQPILVRVIEGAHVVIAGHRRLEAAKIAGLQYVPAIVGTLDDDAAYTMQLAENIQRADLSPMDEARAVMRLREQLGTLTAVAAKINKSVSWCSKRAAIFRDDYPAKVRYLIEKGITEDFDLCSTLAQIGAIDYLSMQIACMDLEQGQLTREQARERLESIKEKRETQIEKDRKNLAEKLVKQKEKKEENEDEKAVKRLALAEKQMSTWWLIFDSKRGETKDWEKLETKAANYWRDFFNDLPDEEYGASYGLGYGFAIATGEGVQYEQVFLKLWGIHYRQDLKLKGMNIETIAPENILQAFMREMEEKYSHAKEKEKSTTE